jgi:hypothetical protein
VESGIGEELASGVGAPDGETDGMLEELPAQRSASSLSAAVAARHFSDGESALAVSVMAQRTAVAEVR